MLGDKEKRISHLHCHWKRHFFVDGAYCKLPHRERSGLYWSSHPLLHTWLSRSCITFWKSWGCWGRSSLSSCASFNVPMLHLICILDFWISDNCYKIKFRITGTDVHTFIRLTERTKLGSTWLSSRTFTVLLLLLIPSGFPVSLPPTKERALGEKGKGKPKLSNLR